MRVQGLGKRNPEMLDTDLNSDIGIKILFSKVDSAEKKQLWTYKTKHAKSGVCSRRINFRK